MLRSMNWSRAAATFQEESNHFLRMIFPVIKSFWLYPLHGSAFRINQSIQKWEPTLIANVWETLHLLHSNVSSCDNSKLIFIGVLSCTDSMEHSLGNSCVTSIKEYKSILFALHKALPVRHVTVLQTQITRTSNAVWN